MRALNPPVSAALIDGGACLGVGLSPRRPGRHAVSGRLALDRDFWGSEHYYGRGLFERTDFAALSEALKGLQGRFVLTLNDVPEVRELFRWARIRAVSVSYTLPGMTARKAAQELIITPK